MKLFQIITYLLISSVGWTQINETFDTSIPANWSQSSTNNFQHNQQFVYTSDFGANAPGCAYLDDYTGMAGMDTLFLETPFMDLTQITNPELTFNLACVNSNFLAPELSLWYDDGNNWVEIPTNWNFQSGFSPSHPLNSNSFTWESATQNLFNLSNLTNVRFAIGAHMINSGFVLLDDISIHSASSSTVLASSIIIDELNSNYTINTNGGTLQMIHTMFPTNVSNNTVTWTTTDPAIATIDQNGVLTGTGNGYVFVRATANDGSGVYDEMAIQIQNQIVGTEEFNLGTFTVFPNPCLNQIQIDSDQSAKSYIISDPSGRLIEQGLISNTTIDVSNLCKGTYLITIQFDQTTSTTTIVKK